MDPTLSELLMVRRKIAPDDLAAPAQTAWTSDASTDTAEIVRAAYEAELSFPIKKASKVTALAGWFDAKLAGKVSLTNAPEAPDTHWGQLLLPLDQEVSLKADDTLNVVLQAYSVGPGPLMTTWRWQVNDGARRGLSTTGEAIDQEQPMERSDLSAFLAELALDPSKLADYLADPDRVM